MSVPTPDFPERRLLFDRFSPYVAPTSRNIGQ